jgi:hypothetical protein
MKRMGLASVVLAVVFPMMAGSAWAGTGIKLCVPKKEGDAILTPTHGKCKKGFKLTGLGMQGKEGKQGPEGKAGVEGKEGGTAGFATSEVATLHGVLPYIKYEEKGIAGKPTIRFSGVNVQIVNGEGKTTTVNGEGNLVIGYDEIYQREQTGSHNLLLGQEQTFTSYGGFLAGFNNTVSAPFASVSGGDASTASGEFASVTGGFHNTASGQNASVTGGAQNTASGINASVSGGFVNTASGVLGATSVSGGYKNTAEFNFSSIFGGKELKTTNEYEAIP